MKNGLKTGHVIAYIVLAVIAVGSLIFGLGVTSGSKKEIDAVQDVYIHQNIENIKEAKVERKEMSDVMHDNKEQIGVLVEVERRKNPRRVKAAEETVSNTAEPDTSE